MKVLHSICQETWKIQQWPQNWEISVFIPIPKGNAKECSNYCTIALITHVSTVMLKILQARLQQYMNHELADVQVGFIKAHKKISTSPILREIQIKIAKMEHSYLIKWLFKKTMNNKRWWGCEERKPSYTVSRNVNWPSHYSEQYGTS